MSRTPRLRNGLQRLPGFILLAAAVALPLETRAAGLTGTCRIEKIKGRPGDYLDLYEWNIHASINDGTAVGASFRVGAGQPSPGMYNFTLGGGIYSLYLDQPIFWGRPRVVTEVDVPAVGTATLDVDLPMDYGCVFGNNSGIWGINPWTLYDSPWYQTFVATGTSITGISFKLAGSNATNMTFSIHRDNGGSITTWPQVGMARTIGGIGVGNDNWIRLRSGDIPTTPGQRYALKLTGSGGSDGKYAIWCRQDFGTGYAGGQAYNSAGQAQPFDIYAMIFSDNDGTLIPYCNLEYEQGDWAGWAGVWTQSLRAMGQGLAGVVLFFAGGDTWEKEITFRIRSGSVNGPQVGPAKTGRGAFQAASAGWVAVSWNPGEVPLTPGQTYFIEMSHPVGFNPARFILSINAYPYGQAYKSSIAQTSTDLFMQVVEYATVVPPAIGRSPGQFVRQVVRGQNLPADVFTVYNIGGGALRYNLTAQASWLSVSPASGRSTGEPVSTTITYNLAGLGTGSYVGTIMIEDLRAINSPQTVVVNLTVTPPPFAPADFDQDGDVDLDDYGHFQGCVSGQGVPQTNPACQNAMLDADNDVDAADLARFRACLSGSNIPANPTCAD